jgi:hypothetical protein
MHHMPATYSFETALKALEEGLRINRTAFCDGGGARRAHQRLRTDMAPERRQDLRVYDEHLQGIGQS